MSQSYNKVLWADKPFARAVIFFIAGLITARYFPVYNWLILLPLAVCMIIFFYREWIIKKVSPYTQGSLLLLITFLAGYCRYVSVLPAMDSNHISHKIDKRHQYIHGEVKSIPKITTRTSFNIAVSGISESADNMQYANGLITAYFDLNDESARTYEPGDEVILYGYTKELQNSRNPHAFDFNDYLRTKHIYWRIEVDEDMHRKTGQKVDSWASRLATSIRSFAINCINKNLNSDDNRSLASAMILGNKNGISDELYNSYTKTGAVHVLAVSGLHVGIICSILFFLFKFILPDKNRNKLLRVAIIAACVFLYCLITGASAAVMRASVMVVLIFIAKYWINTANIYNVLSLAAFILLLYDPKMIFQASFQFSFLALTSIVYFFKPIYNLYPVKNRVGDYLWQLICLSLSAQVLVTPLTIYYFHRFPTYFWLSGIIAVPAAYAILSLGVAMIFIEAVVPALNTWLAIVLNKLIDYFIAGIRFIEALPYSTAESLWLDKYELAFIYLALVLFMIGYTYKNAKYIVYASVGIPLLLLSFTHSHITQLNQSSLTVYDYYKGYLVDVYDGKKCFVFKNDGMPARSEQFITGNQRTYKGINSVKHINIDSNYYLGSVAYSNRLLQVKDKSILIIDSSYESPAETINIDVAIVTKHKTKVENILNRINAKQWIITQNVDYYKQKQWRKQSAPDRTVIINKAGAYSVDLSNI